MEQSNRIFLTKYIMKHSNFNYAEEYETPMCEIVLVKAEGVLCASGDTELDSTIDGYTEKSETYW